MGRSINTKPSTLRSGDERRSNNGTPQSPPLTLSKAASLNPTALVIARQAALAGHESAFMLPASPEVHASTTHTFQRPVSDLTNESRLANES